MIVSYKTQIVAHTDKLKYIASEVCLQIVVHLICLKHFRQTKDDLMKSYENVCEIVRANQKYESDMKTTQMLLNSVMPKTLADKCVITTSNDKLMRTIAGDISLQDKVSILFADIVGFTRLSSGLEASRLVNMLNDLFGRFDKLCYSMKCEKVAILGDCYYCVAGCPEPDEDHAYNCVVMGLKICKTIKGNVFRKDKFLLINIFYQFSVKKTTSLWKVLGGIKQRTPISKGKSSTCALESILAV